MEFKEVVGTRRSIRYYQPWRPVEREKIEIVLQAARLASRATNAEWVKGVVVYRDDIAEEDREGLKTATTTVQLDLAPVWIFWFADPKAPTEGGKTLRELINVGALTTAQGWSEAYIDDVVYPQVLDPIMGAEAILNLVTGCEAGLAISQALLAAVDEGLGTQLTAVVGDRCRRILGVPDHFLPLWAQLLGYPAEDPSAGGQRPRPPLGEIFHEREWGTPWVEDPITTNKLQETKMIQPPAPLPWREAEIRGLARMFGLPQ